MQLRALRKNRGLLCIQSEFEPPPGPLFKARLPETGDVVHQRAVPMSCLHFPARRLPVRLEALQLSDGRRGKQQDSETKAAQQGSTNRAIVNHAWCFDAQPVLLEHRPLPGDWYKCCLTELRPGDRCPRCSENSPTEANQKSRRQIDMTSWQISQLSCRIS